MQRHKIAKQRKKEFFYTFKNIDSYDADIYDTAVAAYNNRESLPNQHTCGNVVADTDNGESFPNQATTSSLIVKELSVNASSLRFNFKFDPVDSLQRTGSTVNVPISLCLAPDSSISFITTISDHAPDIITNALDPSIFFVTTTSILLWTLLLMIMLMMKNVTMKNMMMDTMMDGIVVVTMTMIMMMIIKFSYMIHCSLFPK